MLSAGRGNAQLVPRLDEAHLQVDSLISKGVRCSAHAALTSISSHYNGVHFDAVGQGYAPGKSESDILAISSVATRDVVVLMSKMSAVSICL